MGKTITYTLIGFLLVSCKNFGDKVDLFEGIDFNQEGDWLLVITNTDFDTCGVIFDKEILLKLNSDLEIKTTDECGGTTPDNCVTLYKNGNGVRSSCYCSWEPFSYNLGRLKTAFVPAKLKFVTAKSIERHDVLLDSLKQLSNIYLLYPKDTVIEFPDQLRFDIRLVDNDQDIFEQERPIEREFRQIFKKGRYHVKADWYSSDAGIPKKLGYHVIVDCDSSFLNYFDNLKLEGSKLFKERTDYKFVNKEFDIYYYEWDK